MTAPGNATYLVLLPRRATCLRSRASKGRARRTIGSTTRPTGGLRGCSSGLRSTPPPLCLEKRAPTSTTSGGNQSARATSRTWQRGARGGLLMPTSRTV
eukprot:678828-Prorocentrum_minimum.AAC.1